MRRSNFALLLALLSFVLTPLFGAEDEDDDESIAKTPNYYELKPSIVANMQQGAQYIRCDIQLLTLNSDDHSMVAYHAPALRHEMFLLLSDQEGTALKDTKGKEKFRKNALKAMQNVMQSLAGREVLSDLFFTNFYVQ